MDDHELLREYAQQDSEKAFATLVSRHVDFVYASAFRRVQNPTLAEEVTQNVFIILARKAAQLGPETILAGWLYRTARYAAADLLKSERRRQARERQALALQASIPETTPSLDSVAPRLDHALGRLSEADRTAILLRFFENKSLREVGRAMGIEEEAARKRVTRALAKLRPLLGANGAAPSAAALAVLLASHSAAATPAGLSLRVTTAAFAKAAGLRPSTLALVKAAVRSMLWSKEKAILAASAIVVAGAGLWLIQHEAFSRQPVISRSRPQLAASATNNLRSNVQPEPAGTACMSCHRTNRIQANEALRQSLKSSPLNGVDDLISR